MTQDKSWKYKSIQTEHISPELTTIYAVNMNYSEKKTFHVV